jgi:precorrin-3B synthase
MQTGDGLLVRLVPVGTIGLGTLAKLCAAARMHGNGVVEITARGSMQVRGLTGASAPAFAAEVATLDFVCDDGIPVLTDALAGIDAEELVDGSILASAVRAALAEKKLAAKLAPKIAVVIDGGGTPNLDAISADVRLRAQNSYGGDVVFHVAVGGDSATAASVGVIEGGHEVEAVVRLLEMIARHGRRDRAKDILKSEGISAFRAAVTGLLIPAPALGVRPQREPIGLFPLRDQKIAVGVGIAFGHVDANVFDRLIEAAKSAGAEGIRTAPGRALLAIGLAPAQASSFVAVAEHLGFIVHGQDPRRHVIACAGAPICAAANIPARAIAPVIAAAAAPMLDGSLAIHLSGCAKGCANGNTAALTVVGRAIGCGIVIDGRARDEPIAALSTDALPSRLGSIAREIERDRKPGENAAQTLTRLAERIPELVNREAGNG